MRAPPISEVPAAGSAVCRRSDGYFEWQKRTAGVSGGGETDFRALAIDQRQLLQVFSGRVHKSLVGAEARPVRSREAGTGCRIVEEFISPSLAQKRGQYDRGKLGQDVGLFVVAGTTWAIRDGMEK